MSRRCCVAAVAIALVTASGNHKVMAQAERAPREAARLPLLGSDRKPLDLLRMRPEEVERRLRAEGEQDEQEEQDGQDEKGPAFSDLGLVTPLQPFEESAEELSPPERAADMVEVERVSVFASRRGQGSVPGEVALLNTAEEAHRLVSVYTDAAERTLIHTQERWAGARYVRPLQGLYLPPQERIELRPGGPQLLLVDLRRPLAEGEVITLDLRFQDGSLKQVDAPIRPPRPASVGVGGS